jgi:hypothetical protein
MVFAFLRKSARAGGRRAPVNNSGSDHRRMPPCRVFANLPCGPAASTGQPRSPVARRSCRSRRPVRLAPPPAVRDACRTSKPAFCLRSRSCFSIRVLKIYRRLNSFPATRPPARHTATATIGCARMNSTAWSSRCCSFTDFTGWPGFAGRLGRRVMTWRGCILAVYRESRSRAFRGVRHDFSSPSPCRKRPGTRRRRKAAKK